MKAICLFNDIFLWNFPKLYDGSARRKTYKKMKLLDKETFHTQKRRTRCIYKWQVYVYSTSAIFISSWLWNFGISRNILEDSTDIMWSFIGLQHIKYAQSTSLPRRHDTFKKTKTNYVCCTIPYSVMSIFRYCPTRTNWAGRTINTTIGIAPRKLQSPNLEIVPDIVYYLFIVKRRKKYQSLNCTT